MCEFAVKNVAFHWGRRLGDTWKFYMRRIANT
jgi:hypothetical protein